MNIMCPDHPKWEEFCERLEGLEGCNFHEDEKGKVTWSCKGGNNKDKAEAILKTMEVNIEKSLQCFEDNGGYCDCEILFNVENSYYENIRRNC